MNGKSELEKAFITQVNSCSTFDGYPYKSKEILDDTSIANLFSQQMNFQKLVTGEEVLPQDNPRWYSYHVLAMLEELGEILKADKRWKTHRNTRFEPEEKLDEIADVFITIMNICIFSNVDSKTLIQAVANKIDENIEKLKG